MPKLHDLDEELMVSDVISAIFFAFMNLSSNITPTPSRTRPTPRQTPKSTHSVVLIEPW